MQGGNVLSSWLENLTAKSGSPLSIVTQLGHAGDVGYAGDVGFYSKPGSLQSLVVQNHTMPSVQGSPTYCPYCCQGKKGGHSLEMSLVTEADI